MPSKLTNCRFHTQDGNTWCGPACAMMVLEELGQDISTFDQAGLLADMQAARKQLGWVSDPDGLAHVMKQRAGKTFVVYRDDCERVGSGRIMSSLYTAGLAGSGVSAIVAAAQGTHWIVVCGVKTDVDPTDEEAPEPQIIGFWVNNPFPYLPQQHAQGDDCVNWGWQDEFVPYEEWQASWFLATNSKFVSICDPDPSKDAVARRQVKLPKQVEREPAVRNEILIPEDRIADILSRQLDRHQLRNDPKTRVFTASPKGGPIRVRRIDRNRDFYYLVPAMQEKNVLGYADIDALTGNLRSVVVSGRAKNPFVLDRMAIARTLANRQVEALGRTIELRNGEFTIDPELVWRPCQESPTSHLPFWRIIVGADILYYRIDGLLFRQLTVGPLGA